MLVAARGAEAVRCTAARTMERMATRKVVLCIQDTTELDFSGREIDGLGPLNYEARRGMYVHPTYAVSLEREPLGLLDSWMWAREARAADGLWARLTQGCRSIRSWYFDHPHSLFATRRVSASR